ncbi:glucose/quinate/shikimate family membrane-bound PQQ-dependent dehydrogenase [Devosia rhodophyticola]|uniref:Glucose/quinate/shikimate family membrane-bound PQQ-dependent dehydrogenase n=1 Tax=Devosia rhodophyticola TaxID=3026423 RepID=A0ABY7Z1F3_9HYPH|nr:glucose/quinate/shikimate family membrane-bound PQQ-dependent dehydrogenase [Devosia rhodophyticola]WDR07461.1 glucose/quinate/shikimate family membrane-bound PQQ-dependent dehydrogenase [Devosia rhodophyticola]
MYSRVVAVIIGLCGLALVVGGGWLIGLGGSWYYALTGLAFLATATLIIQRRVLALWVYAGTIALTLVWSIWEVGLDWWALAPRGDVVVILGVLLALPWAVNALGSGPGSRRNAWFGLVGSIVLSMLIGLAALFIPSNDLSGDLPVRETAVRQVDPVPDGEWHAYGRTALGQRYSPLAQITPDNVANLQVAWTFQTGDVRGDDDPVETTYEVTPLKIGDTVYLCTPHDLVFALDAETGAEKWRFDPQLKQPSSQNTQHLTCRGVSYSDGTTQNPPASPTSPDCMARLFLPTVDARLIALSASTGKVCPGFGGEDGTVDLWSNMPNVVGGSYYSTSPPVVTPDLIIVGGAVNDNVSTTEPSGVIRAFDINTGALVWNWDSRNPDQTAPIADGQSYSENSPNSWSVSSYDPALGLIYIPMGNQPPDQYGANRDENVEKYSSSIVALNAETGKVAWVFQGVHHDLWDMDVPAQPSLLDLTIGGQNVPALVAPTKQGEIFVLNRETGEPILPVAEEPAPQGAVEGDFTAPTQPVSALSFKPEPLRESSMWGATLFDQLACRIEFRSLRYDGRYTPPSKQGSIIYPGNFGAFNWGGVAVDPERQVVFAMPVYLAFTSKLVPRPDSEERVVTQADGPAFNENFGAPYAAKMGAFLSPLGLPCQSPPWGYVAGADLTTGQIIYKHVNGTVQDLSPLPLPLKMGVPGIGGPILTKGGVAFLSGTLDYYARAYDVTTGRQLWQSRLPAGGQATPMSYWSEASQRQFVIVVVGGHGSTGTEAGDSIIAYALPES